MVTMMQKLFLRFINLRSDARVGNRTAGSDPIDQQVKKITCANMIEYFALAVTMAKLGLSNNPALLITIHAWNQRQSQAVESATNAARRSSSYPSAVIWPRREDSLLRMDPGSCTLIMALMAATIVDFPNTSRSAPGGNFHRR